MLVCIIEEDWYKVSYSKDNFKVGDHINFVAHTPCGIKFDFSGDIVYAADEYLKVKNVIIDGNKCDSDESCDLYYECIDYPIKG